MSIRGDTGPDIAEILTPETVQRLVAGLARPEVRKDVSGALRASNSDPRVVTALIAALKDHDSDVRASVTTLLATSLDPRAREPLIAALKDEVEGVRLGAAIAVATIVAKTPGADVGALAALKTALDAEENPTLRNVLKTVIAAAQESPVSAADVRTYTAAGLRAGPGEDPIARDAMLRIWEALSA